MQYLLAKSHPKITPKMCNSQWPTNPLNKLAGLKMVFWEYFVAQPMDHPQTHRVAVAISSWWLNQPIWKNWVKLETFTN